MKKIQIMKNPANRRFSCIYIISFNFYLRFLTIFISCNPSNSIRSKYPDLFKGSLKNEFPTLDEINQYFDKLVNKYEEKGLITRYEIGRTYLSNPIYLYRIGGLMKNFYLNNKSGSVTLPDIFHTELHDFPENFISSLHHSREPITVIITMYTATKLLEEFCNEDPQITYIMNNIETWILPVINPDGYKKIEDTQNFFIRKNQNDTFFDQFAKIYQVGVDLNRNYDWFFKKNGNPFDEDFGGGEPFDQSETRAIYNLVNHYKDDSHFPFHMISSFKTAVNFHSFGNFILIPWSHDSSEKLPPFADDIYSELDSITAIKMDSLFHIPALDYSARGDCSDWMLGKYNIVSASPEISAEKDSELESFWPLIIDENDINIGYSVAMNFLLKSSTQISGFITFCDLSNSLRRPQQCQFNSKKLNRRLDGRFEDYNIYEVKIINTGLSESVGRYLYTALSGPTMTNYYSSTRSPAFFSEYNSKMYRDDNNESKINSFTGSRYLNETEFKNLKTDDMLQSSNDYKMNHNNFRPKFFNETFEEIENIFYSEFYNLNSPLPFISFRIDSMKGRSKNGFKNPESKKFYFAIPRRNLSHRDLKLFLCILELSISTRLSDSIRKESFMCHCGLFTVHPGDVSSASSFFITDGKSNELCASAILSANKNFRNEAISDVVSIYGNSIYLNCGFFFSIVQVAWIIGGLIFYSLRTGEFRREIPIKTQICNYLNFLFCCIGMISRKIEHKKALRARKQHRILQSNKTESVQLKNCSGATFRDYVG